MAIAAQLSRYVLVVALPVGYEVAAEFGTRTLQHLDEGTKTATYATFAGASGALLGFGLTAVTILFAVAPRTRLAAVMALQGTRVRQFVTGSLTALAVCALGFATLVALGSQSRSAAWSCAALGLVGALVTAVAELVWLANRLLKILSAQALDEHIPPSSWTPPTSLDPMSYNVPTRGGLGDSNPP